jgi:hypothetical protein
MTTFIMTISCSFAPFGVPRISPYLLLKELLYVVALQARAALPRAF